MIFNSTDELQPNYFRQKIGLILDNRVTDLELALNNLEQNMIRNDTDIREQINALMNSYNTQFITADLIANRANINYLEITNNALISNLNADNVYIENLTVNKPAYDITLNTAHLENVSSLNGNFYRPNLYDPILVTNRTPVQTDRALGYDLDGTIIPIEFQANLNLPPNADYIFTDEYGISQLGRSEDEVVPTTNLIQSYAVYNMWADINNTFSNTYDLINNEILNTTNYINNVYSELNNTIEYVNEFENNTVQEFNNVWNALANVENNVGDLTNYINNEFNNVYEYVDNGFNDSYNYINTTQEEQNVYVNTELNNVWGVINNIDSNAVNALQNQINALTDFINSVTINRGYFNSSSPLRYENATSFLGYNSSVTAGSRVEGTVINFAANVLQFNTNSWSNAALGRIGQPLTNAFRMFHSCAKLNDVNMALIPNTIKDACQMFTYCNNFNQPVNIPDNVINVRDMFTRDYNFNSPVTIGNNVEDTYNMFSNCSNFNQPISIPDSVITADRMFYNCIKFNQPVTFGNNIKSANNMFFNTKFNQPVNIEVEDCSAIFYNCLELNEPIRINANIAVNALRYCSMLNSDVTLGNKITNASQMFISCMNFNSNVIFEDGEYNSLDLSHMLGYCYAFNQQINLPDNISNTAYMFYGCDIFNQPISIPKGTIEMDHMFYGCNNFNQPIEVPNNVINVYEAFLQCYNFNSPVIFGDNVVGFCGVFSQCVNFNQPVNIPDTVTNCFTSFSQCLNFNSPVKLPNNVERMELTFSECRVLNQPFTIPASCNWIVATFSNCNSLNYDINILTEDETVNTYRMFTNCTNMQNRNIHISANLDENSNLYKQLTNGYAGINFTGRVFNDL